jgi:hypothetical protein
LEAELPLGAGTVLLEEEFPLGAGTVLLEETVSFEVEVLFETVLLVVTVVFDMVTFEALQGNMNTGIVKVILEYL